MVLKLLQLYQYSFSFSFTFFFFMLDNIHNSPVVNANQAPIRTCGSFPTCKNIYRTAAVKITFNKITRVTINLLNLPFFSYLPSVSLIIFLIPLYLYYPILSTSLFITIAISSLVIGSFGLFPSM